VVQADLALACYHKQGGCYGRTQRLGYHPLLATRTGARGGPTLRMDSGFWSAKTIKAAPPQDPPLDHGAPDQDHPRGDRRDPRAPLGRDRLPPGGITQVAEAPSRGDGCRQAAGYRLMETSSA
jgi:hypothetical protein